MNTVVERILGLGAIAIVGWNIAGGAIQALAGPCPCYITWNVPQYIGPDSSPCTSYKLCDTSDVCHTSELDTLMQSCGPVTPQTKYCTTYTLGYWDAYLGRCVGGSPNQPVGQGFHTVNRYLSPVYCP